MRLLLLGGPRFLGYHLIEAALARGHEITLFNRGKTFPERFPAVQRLTGDRDGGLDALRGRTWDAAIDTCGYLPRIVRASAEALASSVGSYTFISSISVYAEPAPHGIDETAPVGTLPDPTVEEITGETYGPLKALCEQAAEATMPGRTLVLRPGLIVGPHDPSDRFTYWPVRIARGGEALAPEGPAVTTQFIDVRDLAEWNIRMVEAGQTGVYHVTGPAEPVGLGEIFRVCAQGAGREVRFTWVSEAFLLDHGVGPLGERHAIEMPLWVPKAEQGTLNVNLGKALAAGLTLRPLAETVRDTLAWHAARPSTTLQAGLTPEREAELSKRWHEQA